MIVHSFEITESVRLAAIPPESVAATDGGKCALTWVDLQDPGPDELDGWLDRLGVDDLARRLCTEARDRLGFYPLREEAYFVIPVLVEGGEINEVDHVAFLCRENLLLTIHRKHILDPKWLTALQQSESWLRAPSIAGVVSALMIYMSLDFLDRSTSLRGVVLALEERLERSPETIGAEEILAVRTDILSLGAAVSDQLPSLQGLRASDKPHLRLAAARENMTCALANLQAVDRSLSWLDGRVDALRSGFDMHAQDKTNRRLNMLTILSAIFNPATLLAGIWGMNFVVMPELKLTFAYPLALGLMVLIGVLMYRFFRKGGWLDG